MMEEIVWLLAYRKAIDRESRMRLFSWWDNPSYQDNSPERWRSANGGSWRKRGTS